MYGIIYSPEFDLDIDQIWEDVFEVSKRQDTADRYIYDFIVKIKKKQEFPLSGSPVYYEDHFTGYYYVHFKAYNAFYIVEGEYIRLVRALSSRSDYMRILFGEYYREDLVDNEGTRHLNEDTGE